MVGFVFWFVCFEFGDFVVLGGCLLVLMMVFGGWYCWIDISGFWGN